MGYRFRKSINLGGGFRINVSKSGIGYSWGIPGFRITKTARGTVRTTYSIPGTGISYVEETRRGQRGYPPQQPQQNQYVESFPGVPIESAPIEKFKEAEVGDISSRVERIIRLKSISSLLFIGTILCIFHWVFLLFPLLGIILTVILQFRGYVKLEYTCDDEALSKYETLKRAWKHLTTSEALWQVLSEQFHSDTKRTAGAGRTVGRDKITIKNTCPYFIRSNIEPVHVFLKRESLFFFQTKYLSFAPGK